MSKKPIEADLDPAGTRHTRPGGKIAERAVAASRPGAKPAAGRNRGPGRPGAGAAARAVEDSRRKGGRSR